MQQEFTFLLRETCGPSLSATAGTVVSNDRRAGQESAEAIVPGATSRKTTPDGLTTREGLNLAGRHDHRWSCSGSVEADRLSYRQRPSWQRKSAAQFRKDCQEPPYADPHVRWCGRRGEKSPRRPDSARSSSHSPGIY